MLSDIFINLTILVSFLFLFGQLFQRKDLGEKLPIKNQLLVGFLFGFLGLLLMLYTIRITDNVIIDLRNLAIISSGLIGGPIAAILSCVMIAVFRIAYFGIDTASLVAFIIALLVGMATFVISMLQLARIRKYAYMFLFAMSVSTVALIFLINDQAKLLETLLYYWPVYIVGAILTYLAFEHIIQTNLRYRQMFYNTIMADNLLDMLSTHKPDGTFHNASPSSKKLLGYSPEELMKMNQFELIHAEDLTKVKESLEKHINDLNYSTTLIYRMKRKDGTYIWVETTAKNIHHAGNGHLTEIVCATRDITDRKNAEKELLESKATAEKLASTDYLTGIMNRRAFAERSKTEFLRAERENLEVSLILADIDRFKKINDTYGHDFGDLVLQRFTQCLAGLCRPYDFIGRHGGEEFIICLPNTTCEQAAEIAERLRSKVEQLLIEVPELNQSIHITASFGVASKPSGDQNNIETLITKVDRAMYQAKAKGRNQVYADCT